MRTKALVVGLVGLTAVGSTIACGGAQPEATDMLEQIEAFSGKKVTAEDRDEIIHGPDEVDLVKSGLEETMINATREVMECWKKNPAIPDMRTAAYVVAINKVGTSYAELGIFP